MAILIPDNTQIRITNDFSEPNNAIAFPATKATVAITNPGPVAVDPAGADSSTGQVKVIQALGAAGRNGYIGYNIKRAVPAGGVPNVVRNAIIDGFTGVVAGSPVYIDTLGADASATASGLTHTAPSGTDKVTPEVNFPSAVSATTSVTLVAPVTGTLSALLLAVKTAIVASDTDYWTFSVVNKGQAGAGTTAMLADTAANTTKATSGVTLPAYTAISETLNGTAGNLAVTAGDVIEITATKAASAANLVELSAGFQITPTNVNARQIGVGWTTTRIYFP